MKTEKSCGAVVFTREKGYIEYLIIQSKEGFYGFPKGHMEGLETEKETALREVLEETGVNVELMEGFRTEDMYKFERNGEARLKHVVYFLAEYSCQRPRAQAEELKSLRLTDFETAIAMFQFENLKRILREANEFLNNI